MAAQASAFGVSLPSWSAMDAERRWNRDDAAKANLNSAQAAATQMAFQERMSNTQWQRGIKDMEAAGLNPMLGYMHGGASSPSGAGFAGIQAHKVGSPTAGGSGHLQTAAQVSLDEARADKERAETLPNDKLMEKLQAEIDYIKTQRGTSSALQNVHQQHTKVLREESRIRLKEAESAEAFLLEKNAAELDVIMAEAAHMRTAREIDESQFGVVLRYIERVIHTIGGSLGAAVGGFLGGRAGRGRRP